MRRAEATIEALKALLETVPDAVVERNSVLPEKVPGGGLIIVRDGNAGEPEEALGGFGSTYYQHAVEIEVYVEEVMRRSVMLPSTPSSSRSVLRSEPTRPSAASPLA